MRVSLKYYVFTFFLLLTAFKSSANGAIYFSDPTDTLKVEKKDSLNLQSENDFFLKNLLLADENVKPKNKLVAIALALTLGPFGVHRLYLGTMPKVPIAYTLTLGGGFFILPLIDIFYIIGNRNPEMIENNNYVFIWNKKRKSDE